MAMNLQVAMKRSFNNKFGIANKLWGIIFGSRYAFSKRSGQSNSTAQGSQWFAVALTGPSLCVVGPSGAKLILAPEAFIIAVSESVSSRSAPSNSQNAAHLSHSTAPAVVHLRNHLRMRDWNETECRF